MSMVSHELRTPLNGIIGKLRFCFTFPAALLTSQHLTIHHKAGAKGKYGWDAFEDKGTSHKGHASHTSIIPRDIIELSYSSLRHLSRCSCRGADSVPA